MGAENLTDVGAVGSAVSESEQERSTTRERRERNGPTRETEIAARGGICNQGRIHAAAPAVG